MVKVVKVVKVVKELRVVTKCAVEIYGDLNYSQEQGGRGESRKGEQGEM